MKHLAAVAVIALVAGCKKGEIVADDIHPASRNLFADFNAADTSEVRVIVNRATQGDVPYGWRVSDGQTYMLSTTSGQYQANLYRNDLVRFVCNATGVRDIAVRLDDVQSFTVHLDPAQNGQIVHQVKLDW